MSDSIHTDEHVHPPPPAYELVPPTMPADQGPNGENRPTLPFRARNLFLHQGRESGCSSTEGLC